MIRLDNPRAGRMYLGGALQGMENGKMECWHILGGMVHASGEGCFLAEIQKKYFIQLEPLVQTKNGSITTLAGYHNTSMFCLNEIRTNGTIQVPVSNSGRRIQSGYEERNSCD